MNNVTFMAQGGQSWAWFDLDDTLWDFSGNSLKSLQQVYSLYHLDRYWQTAEAWIDAYHVENSALWRQYERGEVDTATLRVERFRRTLAAVGYECDDLTEASSEIDRRYLSILGSMSTTVPGASQLLERARSQGYHIGVLSNGFSDVQYNKLKNSGLDRYVERVILSEEVGYNKPDARIFDCACQSVGVTAADCVMVGDNPDTDIAGAVAAGWRAIWFNPRGLERTFDDAPVLIANSLDEIFS